LFWFYVLRFVLLVFATPTASDSSFSEESDEEVEETSSSEIPEMVGKNDILKGGIFNGKTVM
jgi:hypothetical protein